MSKFTACEWVVDDVGCYVFAYGNDMMICQMRGEGYLRSKGLSDDEIMDVQKANARLIAAAPELYRMLREELIPTSDYGGMLSLSREAKVHKLLAWIDGEETDA